MVGFSSGASLVLHAAASKLNIKKIVLYEAPYVKGMGGHKRPDDCEGQLKQLIKSGNRSAAVKFFMNKMVGMPAIFASIMSITPVWSKLKAVAHTLPYDAAILGDFSIPSKIADSVSIPAMVMGGSKSNIALRNAVKKLAAAIPRAQCNYLQGQSHNVSMKAIAPELIKFFSN